MVKTMVILAVAYALQAVMRFPRSTSVFHRRRSGARVLLYGFATLGLLASVGLVWLIIHVAQVTVTGTFSGPNLDLSLTLPTRRISDLNEASTRSSFLNPNNPWPGLEPPYALLHPGGPDSGPPSGDDLDFSRRWGQVRK